jgi:hypothetical protein
MNDCPEWREDVPTHLAGKFSECLNRCANELRGVSNSKLLDAETLKRWHTILFREFVPIHYYAGNFRQDDHSRICLGINVGVGGVPGSHFRKVNSLIESLIENARLSISKIEIQWPLLPSDERAKKVALITAKIIGEFIRIHPLNGNGRVSRLLWCWGLFRFSVPQQCRIHPRPIQPYSELMRASMSNDDGPLALCILQHLAANRPSI